MEFTNKELEELAEFVCGRVDALEDILKYNPPNSSEIKKASQELDILNDKLRPYYREA